MKLQIKFTKGIALLLFTQLFINCGGKSTEAPKNLPEDPKNLLHYTVLKDTLTQSPSKVQIVTDIIINDQKVSITPAKLENTLNHLYNERINRTSFEYFDHPNCILIYAYLSKERSESGAAQWIAMISKMPMDTVSKIDFNKAGLHSLKEKEVTKWNLSYTQRKQIWEKMIFAEREGTSEADNLVPLGAGVTQKDISKNINLAYKLKTQKESKIKKDYRITQVVYPEEKSPNPNRGELRYERFF